MLRLYLAIFLGRLVRRVSRFFNLGSGNTWSGEIALLIEPKILEKTSSLLEKMILVTGTNGKTTTVKMIKTILGNSSFTNESGANLLNGIAACLADNYFLIKKRQKKIAVFEVDEAVFLPFLKKVSPDIIVILNLFRDQLDRYGEVNLLAKVLKKALSHLSSTTALILNADDVEVAYLVRNLRNKVTYFGLENGKGLKKEKPESWGDSIFCPECGAKLSFEKVFFSHLGHWFCPNCALKRPKTNVDNRKFQIQSPLIYNYYNLLAAISVGLFFQKKPDYSLNLLLSMKPAFGRWETLIKHRFGAKSITLVLSKNPTGFTESLRAVLKQKDLNSLLLVLNDKIPDGLDVSWIWDINFKNENTLSEVFVSGRRYLDMALRVKYEEGFAGKVIAVSDLSDAISQSLAKVNSNGRLYILATYSAMLSVRKILTGKEIL